MKKTLATMAIVIVISLLFASDFYIGVQSGLSPRGTYWAACADELFSLIKQAKFNNTMTEITSGDHLVPLMGKLNADSIKTVLVDQRIDNSIDPSTWKSPTALALSNYWRFEAEFSSSSDLDGGVKDEHWYCSNHIDKFRSGEPIYLQEKSNEYVWQAAPADSLPNGGWVFSNVGRRWPRNGDPTGQQFRIGDEFQFTGRYYFDDDTTFDAYLANNYLYISFAFSFDDYATLTSADSLLSFDIVGYTGSTFTVLDHENVTLGVSGDLSVLTKGQYDSLPIHNHESGNKLLTLRISLLDMEDRGFLAHKDGNYWKLLMGNISPRVYWHGNATLNLDYLDFYDSVYDELQAIDASTNGGINYLSSVSDLFNTHGNTITNVYGFNEPKQPQLESHGLIERKLSTHLGGTVDGGTELFTSIHDSYIDYIKTGGVPFDNPSLFLDTAKPKLFMPNLYYLEAGHGFNDEMPNSVQAQFNKLHNSYKRYKLKLEQEPSLADTKYYICTQSMGTWFGNELTPYWSWLRPPQETQKAIQLLPLCYGVDGIHSFFFQSWNASEDITRYWAAVNVPDLTNPSSIYLSGAYWGLKEANEKIKVYGPLLSSNRTHDAGTSPQLKWEDSFAITQSENPLAYFDGQIISLPSIGLSGMNVKTSPGLYQGLVHAGIYTNQATGLPSIMLVNRRANYFDTDMGADNPINIPPSLLDNFFIAADTLTTKFLTNQTANTLAGTYPSFYDPYTNEIHVSSNDVIEVDIGPGDGKLLQMCSSLPPVVTSNATLKKTAYLSGVIVIDQGAEVTMMPNTVTRILPNSCIVVTGDSTLNLNGVVDIAAGVSILVEPGSSINFNRAKCTWGIDSYLQVYEAQMNVEYASFAFNPMSELPYGITLSNGSVATLAHVAISGSGGINVLDSDLYVSDIDLVVPANRTGIGISNAPGSHEVHIDNTDSESSISGIGDGLGRGIYCAPAAGLKLSNVLFANLNMGVELEQSNAVTDSIRGCNFENCVTGISLTGRRCMPKISVCSFVKDGLEAEATGVVIYGAYPTISECTFEELEVGVFAEFTASTSGRENFMTGNTFYKCLKGIESRGSSYRVNNNVFTLNRTGINMVTGSNMNLGNSALNSLQNTREHLAFMFDQDFYACVQLYNGHNNFYHDPGPEYTEDALDFAFNDHFQIPVDDERFLIDVSGNWFEDGSVLVDPSSYAQYITYSSLDPYPNLMNSYAVLNRMDNALMLEAQGQYQQAVNLYKDILDEGLESEEQYLASAVDGVYRISGVINDPAWDASSYLDAKTVQYAEDIPGLSVLIDEYRVKCRIETGDFQSAINMVEGRISNPRSAVDSLLAVLDLEMVLVLQNSDETKQAVSTKYSQYKYPSMRAFKTKHHEHLEQLYELAGKAEAEIIIPPKPMISRNYPNPFNPSTTIAFSLPTAGKANLNIYNVKGQKVRDLGNPELTRGHHTVVWDGRDNRGQSVSSGVYFVRLSTAQGNSVRKILLMK